MVSLIGSFVAVSGLYLGPETTLPLVSLLAGLVGIVLLFGRYLMSMARKALKASRQRVARLFGRGEA
jgi:hypothetical protein